MEQLSTEQAFAAMVLFLRGYWERGNSEEIGDILSGLMLLAEHRTADPAYWEDWMNAVTSVLDAAKTPEAWRKFVAQYLALRWANAAPPPVEISSSPAVTTH